MYFFKQNNWAYVEWTVLRELHDLLLRKVLSWYDHIPTKTRSSHRDNSFNISLYRDREMAISDNCFEFFMMANLVKMSY